MAKCIFMKWLPASWKTTYAKSLWINRFNRDEARKEYPHLKESEIKVLEENFMRDNVGNDIVIDNTHLSKSLDWKIKLARSLWYDVEIVDMYEEFCKDKENCVLSYLLECELRNNKREEYVPLSVIHSMFLSNYWEKLIWKEAYIFDIDWTIADATHRMHYIKEWKRDRDWFFWNVSWDRVIEQTVSILKALSGLSTIILVSWRSDTSCKDTFQWLYSNWIQYDFLLMRQSRDKRDDTIVKSEIYDKCLSKFNIKWVFDDRKSVKKMWVDKWLFVFDVNQHDLVF